MCTEPFVAWRPFLSLSFDNPRQDPSVGTLLTLSVSHSLCQATQLKGALVTWPWRYPGFLPTWMPFYSIWLCHLYLGTLSLYKIFTHPRQALIFCAGLSCCLTLTSDTRLHSLPCLGSNLTLGYLGSSFPITPVWSTNLLDIV